jgi:hypothetical protein
MVRRRRLQPAHHCGIHDGRIQAGRFAAMSYTDYPTQAQPTPTVPGRFHVWSHEENACCFNPHGRRRDGADRYRCAWLGCRVGDGRPRPYGEGRAADVHGDADPEMATPPPEQAPVRRYERREWDAVKPLVGRESSRAERRRRASLSIRRGAPTGPFAGGKSVRRRRHVRPARTAAIPGGPTHPASEVRRAMKASARWKSALMRRQRDLGFDRRQQRPQGAGRGGAEDGCAMQVRQRSSTARQAVCGHSVSYEWTLTRR